MLQHQPVLRQCFVLPYVPLLGAGSESGPVWDKLLLSSLLINMEALHQLFSSKKSFIRQQRTGTRLYTDILSWASAPVTGNPDD